MINDLRIRIQTALSTIQDVEAGIPIPDEVVEEYTTYFGYELQMRNTFETYEKDSRVQIALIGRVVRVNEPDENTVAILDQATDDVLEVLKSLNFYCDVQDITIDQGIRKTLISGTAVYDEMNDTIVI